MGRSAMTFVAERVNTFNKKKKKTNEPKTGFTIYFLYDSNCYIIIII